MKLSADPDDLAYNRELLARKPKVYFNGVERKDVQTADEERGRIAVYVLDANGNPHCDDRGVILMQTLKGDVKIVFSGEAE